MFYDEAKLEISKCFKLHNLSLDVEIIEIDKFFDENNGYFIALVNVEGRAIITDMGKTCDHFDITQRELGKYCNRYQLNLNDWTIEKEFNKIEDLTSFIALIDSLMKTYNK